jgi:hypothetical protein
MTSDGWVSFSACVSVVFGSSVLAADAPAKPVQAAPTPGMSVAHSALLTIDATPTDDSLALHIRRVSDQSLVASDDVTVTVDGKNETVMRQSDGSYLLPANDLRGGDARAVDVIVGHDGIREVLSGKVTLAQSSSTGGLLREHKQIAWWLLNITIVLIAAIALSRRKG